MSLIKTEALVVKASDYSESTRLVTLFSPHHGRIRVLAKGIRRLKSQNRGLLEPFSRVDVTVYLKDPSGLGTLKESALISAASALRSDYDRWLLASLVLEVIDRATLPAEDVGELYERISDYIAVVPATDRPQAETLAVLTDMLAWFGFGPDLGRCCLCSGRGPFSGFQIDRCGVTCGRCGGGHAQFRPLPPGTIKVLEHLAMSPADKRTAIRPSRKQVDQLFGLLISLLQYHLDITLTTARMLALENSAANAGH
jgi:DNA repair protein RecO (recombination protein O)